MKSNKRVNWVSVALVGTFLVFAFAGPVKAGHFGSAFNHVYASNYYSSYAMYNGMISLLNDSLDLPAETELYYAYSYMNSAVEQAYAAYMSALAGYQSNPTTMNQYASDYAYYDWYYKEHCLSALYYVYYYEYDYYTPNAILYAYYGDYYNNLAAYWNGLASQGGMN